MYYSHGPYTTVFEERVPEVTYAPMKPTPEDSETSESNVYTSNLPPWADDEWLRQCFAPFGLIVSAKVMVDSNGSPKGYGFIQYTDPNHAKAAVSAMHGVSVDNHWLNVKLAHRDKNKGVMNHPSNNLYVSNLPKSYGLGDLKRLFGPLPITAVTILKNPQTNTSRGVALVRLPTLQHANSAISLLNGIVLPEHDRPLEVKYAESTDEKVMRKGVEAAQAANPPEPIPRKNKERVRRRTKQSATPTESAETSTKSEQKSPPALLPKVPLPVPDKTTIVFVDGLSSEVDDLFLYHLFGPFGAIVSAKLDWNGESGKVQYVSAEDACKAVKALNGVQLQGRSLMVSLVEEEEGPAGA